MVDNYTMPRELRHVPYLRALSLVRMAIVIWALVGALDVEGQDKLIDIGGTQFAIRSVTDFSNASSPW